MPDLTIESKGHSGLDFGDFTDLTRRIFMALHSIEALPDLINIKIE